MRRGSIVRDGVPAVRLRKARGSGSSGDRDAGPSWSQGCVSVRASRSARPRDGDRAPRRRMRFWSIRPPWAEDRHRDERDDPRILPPPIRSRDRSSGAWATTPKLYTQSLRGDAQGHGSRARSPTLRPSLHPFSATAREAEDARPSSPARGGGGRIGGTDPTTGPPKAVVGAGTNSDGAAVTRRRIVARPDLSRRPEPSPAHRARRPR